MAVELASKPPEFPSHPEEVRTDRAEFMKLSAGRRSNTNSRSQKQFHLTQQCFHEMNYMIRGRDLKTLNESNVMTD